MSFSERVDSDICEDQYLKTDKALSLALHMTMRVHVKAQAMVPSGVG